MTMHHLTGQFRQREYDRRRYDMIAEAPLDDCDGVVVWADRRMQPDRRVLNIAADRKVTEYIELYSKVSWLEVEKL